MRYPRLLSLCGALAIAALAFLHDAPAAAQGCPAGQTGVSYQTDELGRNCDVPRNKFDTGVILTLNAATTALPTVNHTSFNGRGLKCTVGDAVIQGGFLQITIQGYDPASQNYYAVLTSQALNSTTASIILTIYPGIANVPGIQVNDVLPRYWRIFPTIIGGATVTATVGCVDLL